MNTAKPENTQNSRIRLIVGTIILVVGFLSPLLIPWVTSTDWSVGLKSLLSGLLAFGIPEIFMLIAIGVMGKPGYEWIKEKVAKFIKPLLPPDTVSRTRYRIGLILFTIPILFGFLEPYLGHFFEGLKNIPIRLYLAFDLLFVASLFVLGGDFWDKLRGLFDYQARISK
jgi:hypothetical protein